MSPHVRAVRHAFLALAVPLAACRLPEFTRDDEPANLVVAGNFAYATLAGAGVGVFELPSGRAIARVAPPAGAASVDDLALADGFLFALDAKSPGALAVFSLREPAAPALIAPAVEVAVGPFSGVAAAHGRVVVSGGTSELSILHYDASGRLGAERGALDLGRGQPDVIVDPEGRIAVVSTHFSLFADTFGLTTLALATPPLPSRPLGRLELNGAGFSPGGARPANFPLVGALDGTTLWMTSGAGLAAIDLADPAAPQRIATLALELHPVHVAVRNGQVVAVGSAPRPELVVVDGRAPRSPRVVMRRSLPAGARPTAVALADGCAVVAARTAGVVVVPLP